MKKIVITTFIMPNEIDDLERVLMDLNKASKYVKGENYELYLALTVSDFLVDWENSKLDKEYFIDRFNKLKSLTEWVGKTSFHIREDIMGCTSLRRIAHSECKDATHFIWLDTDICFDDRVLYYLEASIDRLTETDPHIDKYVISPECVKIWDTTWDCLVNENFLNKEVGYCRINNPFKDAGEIGDVSLETILNDVPGQPKMKFGGGWFNCLSKPLLDRVPLPESMGHYGPDDTFVMWASEKLNQNGEQIYQFKLKNYIVCENYIYRDRTHYDKLIKRIDRKEEFRNQANTSFATEINNIK
jgi:hypothetical protein